MRHLLRPIAIGTFGLAFAIAPAFALQQQDASKTSTDSQTTQTVLDHGLACNRFYDAAFDGNYFLPDDIANAGGFSCSNATDADFADFYHNATTLRAID